MSENLNTHKPASNKQRNTITHHKPNFQLMTMVMIVPATIIVEQLRI
jgi:hypothetical protein